MKIPGDQDLLRRVARGAAMLLALVAVPAAAHDFWIDAPAYRQPAGRPIPLRFLIGDTGAAEPWETLWRKIVSLRDYAPAGVADLQAGVREDAVGAPGGATVTLHGDGTHVIAFESYHAESDLPAAEFNAYAAHEGLVEAIALRKRTGQEGARGRELYSRRAKALVQIGAVPSANATRPIGQTLEIVPLANPYALGADEPLAVRILNHGMPVAGASIALASLDDAPRPEQAALTDAAGRAIFAFPKRGRWRIATVWTQPITHPRAEFDTVFASLTFGY